MPKGKSRECGRKVRIRFCLGYLYKAEFAFAEFELVAQALWTDPGDQSGWLYHRWLIGNGKSLRLTAWYL